MPYQKTKEGRLVNEVTLGDGYPLSNDKQPLKVGGEASIINVSSPTPDGSVDGEVEVKGKLKAKDTFIQGNLKAFSDSDTTPAFMFETKQGVNCMLRVQSAANTRAALMLKNSQGYFELRRDPSTTSLKFTDGTNTPLTLDGNNVEFTNLTDGSITIDSFVDEDNMSSNSATKIPTQQSVKAYVDNEVAGLVDSAPAALDTLNELAAALNDDANFATTVTNSLATKLNLSGGSLTGAIDVTSSSQIGIDVESSFSGPSGVRVTRTSGDSVSLLANYSGFGGGLSSTDALRFTVNDADANSISSPAMYIETNNRVGIGTTSPDTLLHLASSSGDVQLKIEADTDNDNELDNPQVLFAQDGGGVTGGIGLDGSNNMRIENIWSNDAADVVFHASNAEKMRITGTGKVGIGTTSPDVDLDIRGTNPSIILADDSPSDNKFIAFNIDVPSDDVHTISVDQADSLAFGEKLEANDTSLENEWVRITNAGNVGIGTTSPDTPLHVIGETSIQPVNYASNQDAFLIKGGAANNDSWDGHVGVKMKSNASGQPFLTLRGTNNDTLNVVSSKVGIGTTNPTYTLDVKGNIGVDQFIHHNDDDNTAINFTTDTIKLQTDGTTGFTLDSNQNVGIGTTSPSYGLDVANAARFQDQVRFYKTSFPQASFSDDSGTDMLQMGQSGEIFYFKTSDTANDIRFRRSDNTDVLNFDMSNARVGIGTTSPTTTLDVEGTVSYKHISLTDSSDDLDVSGCTVVECTPSGTDTLGGLTGGVQGQILHILKVDSGFGRIIIEHNEGTGNQDIFLSGGSDVMLSSRGGITLYCTGSEWIALDK